MTEIKEDKKCPKCGASLHIETAFCPYCAENISRRTVVKPRRRRLRAAILTLALLAVIVACWLYSQPRAVKGTGSVLYHDRGGTYQLTLSWINSRLEPEERFSQFVEEGGEYRFPIAFFATDKESGSEAGDLFLQKVERFTAACIPQSNGLDSISCTTPAENRAYAPEAALVTYIDFIGQSGTAELLWTFHMKNGDTIRLRTWIEVETSTVYHYYPEDVPMNTAEDLQALIDQIDETVTLDGTVYIHLPPVTYEGDLTVGWRTINMLGCTEGERHTTFTGSIRVSPTHGFGVMYFEDIDFSGSGSGVGVASSVRLHLINCRISGWETGLLAYGSAWINVNDCVFEDNEVGLHFNSSGSSVSHTLFYDNHFRNNGTAVLLESVPTDVTMNFGGTVFSGNGTDIDNRCDQPLELSEVIFDTVPSE